MDKKGAPVSAAEVRDTAELARLYLPDAELEQVGADLASMLAYAEQLAEIDVTGVPPMTHPIAMDCPLRADIVGKHDDLAAALRNAPAAEPPFFSVPEIFSSREPTQDDDSGRGR